MTGAVRRCAQFGFGSCGGVCVPVGESCEVQPAFVLDSTTIDNITAVCPSQFATCDAPHAGCVDGLAEMIQTGSVMLSPVASQTLADLSALSYCAALFLRPPPMFDTQILPAGTNTSSVCELDAVTDCCIGTDQCPATCNAHSHITETTFGPYGQPQEILRCVCDECGLDFPDEYPVDESTWCQVLGFGFCNGICVPPGATCGTSLPPTTAANDVLPTQTAEFEGQCKTFQLTISLDFATMFATDADIITFKIAV